MRQIISVCVLSILIACSDAPEVTPAIPEIDAAPAAEASMSNPLAIETYQGAVLGDWADASEQIRVFQGLPYARPPVGELRWQPPQAPTNWSEQRLAVTPGPACWQAVNSESFVWSRGEFPRSEDCLYLNVWSRAQATDDAVMVWFHGGAHTVGMAHEKIFDGTELAKRGVVIVTVNYRLGPFGFLAYPALAQESSHNSAGNYGLLDKIAALNWVRDNIAQFGGDPQNVTIFGQSAGSQSVCSLMVSPLARGLFHKAIGQSAACVNPLPAADANGLRRGERLAAALGDDPSLADMRAATAEQILDAAERSGWATQSRIVVDGWVLPHSQDAMYAAAEQAKVPLLLGSLSNEGHMLFPLNEQLDELELEADVEQLIGAELAPQLLEHYRTQAAHSPGLAQRDIRTDLFMAYGMRRWAGYQAASGQPTYLYFLDHPTPAFRLYWPENVDLQLPDGPRSAGAYHSGDLAYVFGNTRKVGMGWRAEDHDLSAMMTRYWTNFAKHGDPNGDGLPQWQRYDRTDHHTLLLRPAAHTVAGVRREILDLWDQRYALQ